MEPGSAKAFGCVSASVGARDRFCHASRIDAAGREATAGGLLVLAAQVVAEVFRQPP